MRSNRTIDTQAQRLFLGRRLVYTYEVADHAHMDVDIVRSSAHDAVGRLCFRIDMDAMAWKSRPALMHATASPTTYASMRWLPPNAWSPASRGEHPKER